MKPRYQHDCDRCVFLGHIVYPSPRSTWKGDWPNQTLVKAWTVDEHADLYCCMSEKPEDAETLGRSLIARHSSKGSDYASCPHNLVRRDYFKNELSSHGPAVIAAYWFAVAKGLIQHQPTEQKKVRHG